ncbi:MULTISPECIES: GNAT family N-acetyltransferase [unclassified Frondihabitans]|uniref:GNAT family N-acetyltransferase n=1 Tax=unclassified Frondihabitans TaxID=2626248 RepID=UPI000F4DFD65|nr:MULTISPECIES: GNAT family N-acetyltransferase [unclassified Frondihabitans]RPE76147.1 acetyltransferase (GNAT) family protein [Frondihabitans sp. PhB153]RPF05577.1 acetyltransferase (GNAT) family protein [Frondihabitans sp. PhB161]
MTISLQPMPPQRLAPWLDHTAASYIESRMKAGDSRDQAVANSDASLACTFPLGKPAPDQHPFNVLADGEIVGILWIGVIDPASKGWWVWDIEIDEAHRGRGHGRAAMELAERAPKELGAATLGLNDFGYNTVARALYESLGYTTTSVQMKKPLQPQDKLGYASE